MPTRKQSKVESPLAKINVVLVYALLFITFCFANIYVARCEIDLIMQYSADYSVDFAVPTNTTGFIITLLTSSFTSVLLLELYMSMYYYFAYRHMRGFMPFSSKEFKNNLRPFMVLRNVIWGLLSLLAFLPSGYFIPLTVSFFETLSNLIIVFPFYYYMKKLYIVDGFGGKVLVSFAFPLFIFSVISSIFAFV